jgi:hypothetical protein
MRARKLLVNVGKLAGGTALGLGLLAFSAQVSHAQGSVDIGTSDGGPGSVVPVEISLNGTGDQTIVAETNDIGFPPTAGIRANDAGDPDCTLNPAIMKGNTAFAFRPRDCTPGTDCNAIRATIISFNPSESDTDIPDGLLYTCNVTVPAGATIGSTIALENQVAGITNVDREDIDVSEASADGAVNVVEVTPTPTATATLGEPTSTNTPAEPTATSTRTPRPGGGGGNEEDDGCQMVAPADASMGWMLLVPAALLIWRRRRAL